MAEEVQKPQPDQDIPSISLNQRSYSGLNVISGRIAEEEVVDLQWPRAMQTYKEMSKDATISPALNLMEMAIRQVSWHIEVPKGMEGKLDKEVEFLEQVMEDMEHPFSTFIARAATFNRYGFSAVEKVFRVRNEESGSKYSDNRIGIRCLPLITQDSIESWTFSADGRKVTGLVQTVNIPKSEDGGWTYTPVKSKQKISRQKYMLFRNNPFKDSPEGESPLRDCYTAWRFKRALEEFESMGVSQDMRGLKLLYLPPRYLDPNASPEDKAVNL